MGWEEPLRATGQISFCQNSCIRWRQPHWGHDHVCCQEPFTLLYPVWANVNATLGMALPSAGTVISHWVRVALQLPVCSSARIFYFHSFPQKYRAHQFYITGLLKHKLNIFKLKWLMYVLVFLQCPLELRGSRSGQIINSPPLSRSPFISPFLSSFYHSLSPSLWGLN